MSAKKKLRITYPSSEKVYIAGEINKIKVGMRMIKLTDTLSGGSDTVDKKNNPVVVYDTSGPYSDPKIVTDALNGIPRIRETWGRRRKDITPGSEVAMDDYPPFTPYRAKKGKAVTQMFYAKRRMITPEMEYVAIRENQQLELLGLKSYITPDFVRKEVASGQAIIPANINHPEIEPMIIGRKFLVKVNNCIGHPSIEPEVDDMIEKAIWSCKWGGDMLTDISTGSRIHEVRERVIRNCPVPAGTVPAYQALEKVGGEIKALNWPAYRDTLIEQAEQGVDFFVIHAALLKKHLDFTFPRLTGIVSKGGLIMSEWMKQHNEENFLYTHFDDICDIAKSYDAVLLLGNGLHPGSIYDANDSAQYAELRVMGRLVDRAWEQFVQVMTLCSGHIPMNKIHEYIKEQQYHCSGAPLCSFGPATTDISCGYDHITSTIGAAQTAWHGASMIGCIPVKETFESPTYDDIRNSIVAYKIAAHSADIAKGHPGSQVRDNALSKARSESRWKDELNLSIDPERASKYLKETL
ncbi:MAG: phosphomethylpyrimidine synthase ThiC [Tannerellaceae bacterium]|jgi:phosphomethylpyrimidine synthase|nr:phosphomethylpyrimidine synthase ThiC [Tannerellaceae bacterium]